MLARKTNRACWTITTLGLGLSALLIQPEIATSSGQGAEPVIRIEEDWQLVLNEPNDDVDSPQFHTVMSPQEDLDSYYVQVIWNYRESPEFVSGGVQLHSYNGDTQLRRRTVERRQLSTTAETITWTQALTLEASWVTFEVINGQSTTWGTFGRDMNIPLDASLDDLSTYSTDASVQNACVTYGSNRVDQLVITQVRRYGPSGLVSVDNVPKIVFQFEDDQ